MKDPKLNMDDSGDSVLDSKAMLAIDGDDVLSFLGTFGNYQRLQIFLFFFIGIVVSFPVLSGMFVGRDIGFQCAVENATIVASQNRTVDVGQCSIKVFEGNSSVLLSEEKCDDYVFDGGAALSYISEWRMVCDDESVGQLPQTLTMVGMGLGASLLPQIGDRFGRKKLAMGSLVSLAVVTLGMAFANQFGLFLFLKFLSGFANQGFMVPMAVLTMELLRTEIRSMSILFIVCFWVASAMVMGAIGSSLRHWHWRDMQILIACIMAGVMIGYWFLDESLRWLLANGKVKETKAILKKACRYNNKDYEKLKSTILEKGKKTDEEDDSQKLLSQDHESPKQVEVLDVVPPSHNIFTILKNRETRKITFVMVYLWMVCALTYYGLLLLSTSLAGDPYVNYFILSAIEVPSGFFMFYCIQKFGRKKTIVVYQFISGSTLLSAALLAQFGPSTRTTVILQTCFTVVGQFFIAGTFNAIWLYTPELYPTNLRITGIGMSSASARIGAMFSPFIKLMARKAVWSPGVLFSVLCFISSFLLTLLPETRWRELPKDVSDIELWIRSDKKVKERGDNDIALDENA